MRLLYGALECLFQFGLGRDTCNKMLAIERTQRRAVLSNFRLKWIGAGRPRSLTFMELLSFVN